jgi:hypothetical protein
MTVDDMRLGRLLLGIRALPGWLAAVARRRPAVGGELGGARRDRIQPLVDRFVELGFVRLHDGEDGLAGGVVAQFWKLRPQQADGITDAASFHAFAEPGWAKAVTTFIVTPDGDGSLLTTTTAVAPTDPAARRAFARYWLLIRGPSGLIRREWLAAIARRAELPQRRS